jgi:hypothetical protein
MTTRLANDPTHWRNRAQEARTRAAEMNDAEAKRQMLGIARGYERLAERAEERLAATSIDEGHYHALRPNKKPA